MRNAILITAWSLLTAPLFAQPAADWRVVREDAQQLTIEFRPQFTRLRMPSADGRDGAWYSLAGGETPGRDSLVDLMPTRTFPVLLPSRAFSVHVVEAQFRDTVDDAIYATAVQVPLTDFGRTLKGKDLASSGSIPPSKSLARIEDLTPRGNSYVGRLRISPLQILPGGRIRIYSRIVVQIDHAASGAGSASALLLTTSGPPGNVRSVRNVTATNSVLSQGTWYRFDVTDEGVYRIDLGYLQRSGVSLPSSTPIDGIRIFGNGGRVLPENLLTARPADLQEVPRYVVDRNGNGILDADDYLLVFCRSVRGWDYVPAQKTFRHHIHPYTEHNSYFIALGLPGTGLRMDTVASDPQAGATAVNDFQEHLFLEQERYNLIRSGRRWVGQLFDQYTNAVTYTNLLNGLVADAPILYRYDLLSHSATVDTFIVTENDVPLGSPVRMYTVDVSPSNNESPYAYEALVDGVTRTGGLPDNRSLMKFRFASTNQSAQAWLDWFEILYRRRFEAVGDYLQFSSPDSTADFAYTISGLSSRDALVFDVTDHNAVKRVTQLSFDATDAGICRFARPQTAGSVREYVVAGPNSLRTPAAAVSVPNSNLHGLQTPEDFIIISPTDFLPQADRLKQFREQHDSLRTLVVDIATIRNEFGGGLPDVMAVRDFLRYTQTSWPVAPRYVLLFGNGHYDYKNIASSAPNWIPPYETAESNYQIYSYASDDFFVFLTPNDTHVSMAIGRIPARTLDDATVMVDKTISYATTAPLDPWRNRITFVADDDITSNGYEPNWHTPQSEQLANQFTPNSFEKRKIYLIEYPTVNSAAGRRKPDVNKAIDDALNEGTLIINYIGHGNERLWAHEAVFTREGDLPQLTNRDRLTFLVGATCNFAQYDDPQEQSTGEAILTMSAGGAIAEVTASRAVYSSDNAAMNEILFGYLFQRDANGRPARIGDAMYQTKQIRNFVNDQKYHLLGDPTVRLRMPESPATVDSVNGRSTASMSYVPSLGMAVVKGTVKNSSGTVATGFTGRGIITLFDARRVVAIPRWAPFVFTENGSQLYQGEVSIRNGIYEAAFPVPKDVSFGGPSRISFYGWNGADDASGYTENLQISGIDSTVTPDSTGPAVDLFLGDLSFRSGDLTPPTTTLIVRLSDQSGINTSTVGVGHRLEARISDPDETIDLSNYYRSDLDTYRSGEVRYPLTDLPEGRHTVTVRAWDIQNNSSQAEIAFEVRTAGALEVLRPMNVPDPFAERTTFTFQRVSTDPIDVEVRIYSVAGRLLQTLSETGIVDRFVQLPWDGRDREGDRVANGVYFYRISARNIDGSQHAEAIGKLAVVR